MFRSLSAPLAFGLAALWFGAFAADGAEADQRGRRYRPRSHHSSYSYSRGYRRSSHRYTVPRFGFGRHAYDRHRSSGRYYDSHRGYSHHRSGGGIWFSYSRDRGHDRRGWRSRSHRRDWSPRSYWGGGRSYRGGCR